MIRLESTALKLFLLLILCIFFGGLFSIIGLFLVTAIWDIPFLETSEIFNNVDSLENVNPLKFLQLFNSLGLFVIPGIVFAILFIPNKLKGLNLHRTSPINNYGFVVLLFVSLIPIINYSVGFNEGISLPESLSGLEQWMKNAEENAKKLTLAFLTMDSPMGLLANLFLIAVIPAIGEELIFRGLLQNIINAKSRNYHIGIWVSAILFSAIHLQFYGFIPRMLLGAFFGYLLVWSGSLWLPIFAHFINNATGVLVAYYYGSGNLENEIDQIGSTEGTGYFVLISLAAFSSLFYYFKKAQKNPAQGGI